jgi:hypothetical protein
MITISFAGWLIPAAITLIGIIWALSRNTGSGMFSGIGNLLALVPVLLVSCIAWMIYAFFK